MTAAVNAEKYTSIFYKKGTLTWFFL